jgi:L-lysine exporter family protein LysE/ArgO
VITGAALGTLVSGLLFGLSLIVAIGPQNAFLVRQGARRRHVAIVVAICAVSDVVLIAAGVSGTGAALAGRPWLMTLARVGGAVALLAYAGLAARRAVQGTAVDRATAPTRSGAMAAIAACLAFTWLNPGVYIDTIVLLGSVAHTEAPRQWWFGAGAAIASVLWFAALAAGAYLAHARLTRPRVWRAMDCFVAVVMTVTAVRIAF